MNIIIIGGAGFLGTNLTNYLLLIKEVKKITIIDDLSSGNSKFIKHHDKIEFKHIDIFKIDKLKEVLTGEIDYIFHLAAHFANAFSIKYPISDSQTNVTSIINILECSKNIKGLKKIIYTSSSCVYGNNNEIMKESNCVYPTETPYAINKLTGELYFKFYAHYFNIPSITIRIFNTYGPYELAGEQRNVIPKFIDSALKNKPLKIKGTGLETRDFTYVNDTIELLYKAAISKINDGSIFNGGTGISTGIKSLAELIIKLTESNSTIQYIKKRNWDYIDHRVSDIEKSSLLLNYHPKYKIEDGLKETIKWYKNVIK